MVTSRGEFAAVSVEGAPVEAASAPRRPVLLLPGWTGSKEDFLAVLGGIAATGRRVLTVDQRGQYETPGPDDLAAYTLEAFGADAVAIADAWTARGDGPTTPVHVVGHSFGGLVARAAALTDPTGFASVTLLASGPSRLEGSKGAQLRVMAAALPVVGLQTLYVVKRQLERTNGDAQPVSADIEEFLRQRFCTGVPASLEAMTRHLIDAPDRVGELAATGLPVRVITGVDDDAWTLAEQERMAERLGARYVVIDGAGHSPAVETPERLVAELVAFWDDVEARPAAS